MTKTQIMLNHLEAGNVKEALAIAKTFRIGFTKEESKQLTRASEMYLGSKLYEQMGYSKEVEIGKAVATLTSKYEKYMGVAN